MKMLLVIFSLAVLTSSLPTSLNNEITGSIVTEKPYSNHKLIRITPETEDQIEFLRRMQEDEDLWNVDFWSGARDIGNEVVLRIPASAWQNMTQTFDTKLFDISILNENLQDIVDREKAQVNGSRRKGSRSSSTTTTRSPIGHYASYSSMRDYVYQSYQNNLDVVKLILFPNVTHENRDLWILKLGEESNRPKKGIFIEGGAHAREWLSPATVLFIFDQLLKDYRRITLTRGADNNNNDNADTELTDDDVTMCLLKEYDFYFLPLLNPDGYEFTHTSERFWRKNRKPFFSIEENRYCHGVDLNRNWGHGWGGKGSSARACSDTFRGPTPFSEGETFATKEFLEEKKDDIKMYVSFHSFGQFILTPWGNDRGNPYPRDYFDLYNVAIKGVRGLRRLLIPGSEIENAGVYSIGPAAAVLYEASGSSDDWIKAVAGIKYSYTVELPPHHRSHRIPGFAPPESYIPLVGSQWTAALKEMVRSLDLTKCQNSAENVAWRRPRSAEEDGR